MNRFTLIPALFALSCSGSAPEETATETGETDADTDTDADADADTDADPNLATISGTITLPGGGPAERFRVNVCRDVCRTVPTEADGTYKVEAIDPEVWAFYVLPYGESEYAAPYGPIEFGVGQNLTQNIELMPVAGSARLDVGEPVTLGSFGSFTPTSAWQTSLSEAVTEVTYTEVAGPTQRTNDTINGETVEGVVYLGEFEANGEGTLRIARNGLAEGTSRNVYIAELPEEAGWTLLGTVVAQGEDNLMLGDLTVNHFMAIAVTIPAQ